LLESYLDGLKKTGKKVVFIDEFPWLATARSKFLTAFEHFWNTYCTKRNDLVVVICGSAASFMVNRVLTYTPSPKGNGFHWLLRSHGQYFLAVSCRFLLPTANAIRLTGHHPRLPDG